MFLYCKDVAKLFEDVLYIVISLATAVFLLPLFLLHNHSFSVDSYFMLLHSSSHKCLDMSDRFIFFQSISSCRKLPYAQNVGIYTHYQ